MTHRFLLAFLMVLLLPGVWKLQAQGDEGDARVQELYSQAKAAQSRGDMAGAIAKYEEILRIAPRLGPA